MGRALDDAIALEQIEAAREGGLIDSEGGLELLEVRLPLARDVARMLY